MRATEERKSEIVDEMERSMEDRQQARRDRELAEQEDLNQGIQTGTYDSRRSGINWGPSYRRRRKVAKAHRSPAG